MRTGSWLVVLAACGAPAVRGSAITLHPACGDDACLTRSAAAVAAVAANEAQIETDPEAALAAVDATAKEGPFDRTTYARLWRQRGMANALLAYAAAADAKDDPANAAAHDADRDAHQRAAIDAFDMLLAIDPTHRLEYTLSPQTTFVFQDAIAQAAKRATPSLDLDWKRDARVGDDVPVDVEVVADPKQFLAHGLLFVRARGSHDWKTADVALAPAGDYRRILLPGSLTAGAKQATALELYLRAYDPAGNEVLDWASPDRPREVPLRWEPPPPWWRKWWVWTIAAGVAAGATGVIVYAADWQPSADVGGTVSR